MIGFPRRGRIERIVFLFDYPFSARDYDRFGIDLLKRERFEVEVWNLAPWLKPKVHSEVTVPDPIDFSGYRIFNDKAEVDAALSQLGRGAFIVNVIGYRPDTDPLYKMMSRYHIPYAIPLNNALPRPDPAPLGLARAVVSQIKRAAMALTGYAYNVPVRQFGVPPPEVILAGGANSVLNNANPVGRSTRILWTHTLDYDIYLNERDDDCEPTNTTVFLDEFLPLHPDYIHSATSSPISPEDYYPALCRFFGNFEARTGTRVVIAAHPRSTYDLLPDYFEGRETRKGGTAKLVRSARYVLLHGSTAVNFAVLYQKPMVFLTCRQIDDSSLGQAIDRMAGVFDKKPVDFKAGLLSDLDSLSTVDEGAYASYKRLYIKVPGSPELPVWRIFADYLKKRSM